MTKIAAVDVDGVCADLHTEWLARYNADHDDDLTTERIRQWDMLPYVKPECGANIYKYLRDPDLYDNVLPVAGALDGVERLREIGYRVVFVTSCGKENAEGKWNWLERNGFLPAKPQNPDLVIANDKSLIQSHILIDDHTGNFKSWNGYRGILFSAPHNEDYPEVHNWNRAKNWGEVVDLADVLFRQLAPESETILEEAQRLVHGNRGADYGHPIHDYERTGRMWGAILGIPDIDPRIACLMMGAVKISREVNKHKRDNLTDLAGYAECASMVADKQSEAK